MEVAPEDGVQVVSEIIKTGKIMSLDIKEMEPIKNSKFIKGDILKETTKNQVIHFFGSNLDVIISDMAADTTGNKSLDSIRTNLLCSEVIKFSKKPLNQKVY